jgi:hypothetical protein
VTDAAKAYYQDLAERRRTARGSHNKKRGGGKTVNLPSDGLSLKEVREINGTPTTYKMGEPVRFSDFEKWPEDIQAEYLQGVQTKYKANLTDFAHMLGLKRKDFDTWRSGRLRGKTMGRARPGPEWDKFLERAPWKVESEIWAETYATPPQEREPLVQLKTEHQKKSTEREPEPGSIEAFLRMLPELKAAGAKIRIEVEL